MEEDASGDSRCGVRQMEARRPARASATAATLSDRCGLTRLWRWSIAPGLRVAGPGLSGILLGRCFGFDEMNRQVVVLLAW